MKWFSSVIERLADLAHDKIGTAGYVAFCVVAFTVWIVLNTLWALHRYEWDPYPFILLNLVLSAQAMITAPLIMIAQHKAEQRDREHEKRRRAQEDAHDQRMLHIAEASLAILEHLKRILPPASG